MVLWLLSHLTMVSLFVFLSGNTVTFSLNKSSLLTKQTLHSKYRNPETVVDLLKKKSN